jgi:hypothetical protein
LALGVRHLRALTERQVNFDRCTGLAALRIRSWLVRYERSQDRIRSARLIALPLLTTPAGPMALEHFKLLLRLERGIQEVIRSEWKKESLRWELLTGLGCRLRRRPDRSDFPESPIRPVDPDSAEALLLLPLSDGMEDLPGDFRVRLASAKQSSSARVFRPSGSPRWRVEWIE